MYIVVVEKGVNNYVDILVKISIHYGMHVSI